VSDHPDHSYRVLLKSFLCVTDRSNDPAVEILYPPHIVNDRKIRDVVKKPIDGNVAAKGILSGRSETVRPDKRPILLFDLFEFRSASKGRDFNDLSSFEEDLNQSKPSADNSAVSKEGIDLMGVGIGRDIEVFWGFSQQEIPNASSYEIGQESMVTKTVENLEGFFVDLLS
jgi:hypothetical protein